MIMELMQTAVNSGVNKYEFAHRTLKIWLKINGYDTDLINWGKEPEEIVNEVQNMIDEIKADEEWEAQNG